MAEGGAVILHCVIPGGIKMTQWGFGVLVLLLVVALLVGVPKIPTFESIYYLIVKIYRTERNRAQ